MKTPLKLLAGLSLALSLPLGLAACSSAATPSATASDPAPLGSQDTINDVGGSVASDLEQTLASLTDPGTVGAQGLSAQASGCRTADPASSSLTASGKPVDTDGDGVPDKVTWVYTNCTRAGSVLSGQEQVSDPNADPAQAGSFLIQPMNLAYAYTRADGTVRTVTKNGSSTGTESGRNTLSIQRNVTDSVTDTAHMGRTATWLNQVTVVFTAASGGAIDRRNALPAGMVTVDGPRQWTVTNNGGSVTRYVSIKTTTPLAYDPTCSTTADAIFGSNHARSGSFNVLVYGDAARANLFKTITVTYANCAVSVTSS